MIPCSLATILYIMLKCNIDRFDAIHRLPAACGNQLLVCYWTDNGMETEGLINASNRMSKAQSEFEKMANRKHNFNIE